MATKWACVGPGKISSDFFTAIQDNLPATDHEFIAVASRDVEKAQKFAEKFKFKKAYGSYDELAQDKDVEIVYIGTLHVTHVELSLKMLEAGKHVLCEKPMAMNLKQAKQVLDLAKSKKLLFIEGVWSRWFPVYTQIRKEMADGTLGDIRLVQANFCVPIASVQRLNTLEMGGGGCLDIGIYLIQFACMVFREMPESITVVGNLMSTGVDESAVIVLKYKNGAMANLTYHVDAGTGTNTAFILGKKGRVEVEFPFWAPTRCTTPTGTYEFALKDNEYNFINSAGFQYEAAAARDCLINGQTENDLYSHADSELVNGIMDEVRRQLGMKYPDFD